MKFKSRSSYYAHVNKANLSLALLERYGKIINHDFSAEIPEMEKQLVADEAPTYLSPASTIEEAINQRDYYHRLYNKMLEKVRILEFENAGLKKELGR